MRFIQPLDPYKGPRLKEPVDDAFGENALENIYNMTAGRREDYVNPTADGSVSCRSGAPSNQIIKKHGIRGRSANRN